MLRAINTTTLRCCKTMMLQNSTKASLSTLSFTPSLFNCNMNGTQSYHNLDVTRINAVLSPPSPLITIPSTLTKIYKQITSQISNYLIATLSRDLTLVTIDSMVRKIDEVEETSCWEDVSSTPFIMEEQSLLLDELSIWQISTLKRRKKMMNKHKLRKRKKKMRLKTRK